MIVLADYLLLLLTVLKGRGLKDRINFLIHAHSIQLERDSLLKGEECYKV